MQREKNWNICSVENFISSMPNNGVASVVSFLLNQQIITVEPAGLCFFFVRSFGRSVGCLLVPVDCLLCSVFHLTCNNIPFESLFLLVGVCTRTTTARMTMILARSTKANRIHSIFAAVGSFFFFIKALFLIFFLPRMNAQS